MPAPLPTSPLAPTAMNAAPVAAIIIMTTIVARFAAMAF